MENFQELAQELINTQREIRQLESNKERLKYQLISYVIEHGEISCIGGKVYPVEGSEPSRLNQSSLLFELQARFNISENDASEIIQASKTSASRLPTIAVLLD